MAAYYGVIKVFKWVFDGRIAFYESTIYSNKPHWRPREFVKSASRYSVTTTLKCTGTKGSDKFYEIRQRFWPKIREVIHF
jgi:hypothetical protein